MKLYVDDIRNPDDFVGPGWHWAKTVTEAIRVLATQEVSEVSLDHDISHQVTMSDAVHDSPISRPYPCGETFEAVAWYLKAVDFRGPITIHTANPAGAVKMSRILTGYFDVRVQMGQPVNRLEAE